MKYLDQINSFRDSESEIAAARTDEEIKRIEATSKSDERKM